MNFDDAPPSDEPRTADHYQHPDCVEVVYAVAEGRVLTLREYDSPEAFERAVADARYLGIHEGVEALPGPEAFADEGNGRDHEDEEGATDDRTDEVDSHDENDDPA
ncbi:hypothetical protein [Halomarina pelagica]|uniref:hypothetical protein n=1 Tax=Halomarina pelagica TaxID=2961599 RepID=UPI0020C2438E|nr:hypothetical protein [Halomarina sp. BND7]